MHFDSHKHYCGKGQAHEGKEVVMLCLNQECDNKRLCCLVCIDQLHRKHQLISLYRFQEMLAVLTKAGDPEDRQRVIQLLTDFQEQVSKQLSQSLAEFQKEILRSKEQLRAVIDLAKESVGLEFSSEDIGQIYANLDNATVCKYLDLIRQAEGQALKDPESAGKTLDGAHLFLSKTINDTDKMCLRGMDDVSNALTKLKKLLDSQVKGYKQILFSKEYKSTALEISEDLKTVKRFEGTGSYPVAMLEHPLTELSNEFSVTLKEQPGNKGCWLGVGVHDIVKGHSYKACYGIGKGTWGIDQVGSSHQSAYSWSHHDPTFNSQPKVGWTFAEGDTITIRVDFSKSVVIFSKCQSVYQMPIQLNLGEIHGFVGCTFLDDVWQLP